MPFVNVKTNTQLNKGRILKLKNAVGEAISLIPGKSEDWLMVGVDQQNIFFKGTEDPAAMIQVQIYGEATKAAMNSLTEKLTEIACECLSVKPERVYVSYMLTPDWGWNGNNF